MHTLVKQQCNTAMLLNNIAIAIMQLLNNCSVTFAQITYKSAIATSAANKHNNVYKIVTANVQLFNNISAATSVYANAVKKSAAQNSNNNAQAIAAFTAQSNYYTHNANCYSIVQHNTNNNLYLYCIYNSVSNTQYFINNATATKQQVAQLLTASAAKQLLNNSTTTHNVTNNITHNVVVRTIALANIISITANKQTINFN